MHVVLLEREIFEVIQESNISANNITIRWMYSIPIENIIYESH